jgi:hypothetical protein
MLFNMAAAPALTAPSFLLTGALNLAATEASKFRYKGAIHRVRPDSPQQKKGERQAFA